MKNATTILSAIVVPLALATGLAASPAINAAIVPPARGGDNITALDCLAADNLTSTSSFSRQPGSCI
jgi:hypothetical protein